MLSDKPRPLPSSPPSELNLVTLNCWGLLHISAQRTPRLAEIGRQLARLDPEPDIVCLQECWVTADYEAIRAATRETLPHAKFYYAGVWGAGLAILSRWPIVRSNYFHYPLNGRPSAFWRGDWYVGKGIATARIRFGPGQQDVVDVFNTHTHAPYGTEESSAYTVHRLAQAWHLSKLLSDASESGNLVLSLGDYNMLPVSHHHRLITAHSPLRDVWLELFPDSSLGPANHPAQAARNLPIPTADHNLLVNGATSDGAYNTWRWSKQQRAKLARGEACPVDPGTPCPNGKRLDYIFASTAAAPAPDSSSSSSSSSSAPEPAEVSGWVVHAATVGMTKRHPDLLCSLSDHFAVCATLRRHTTDKKKPNKAYDAQLRRQPHHAQGLPAEVYAEILERTRRCRDGEVKQQRWRAWHFYASLVVWVGCLVAVWFSPRNYVTFLLLLVGSLVLASGVVDGLIALLFFSSELRALQEFEWDMVQAHTVAKRETGAKVGGD